MAYKFGGASNFILNIVELQNTITSASGVSPLQALSNTVAQIQEMVIYDEKRIATNVISAYNTSPIQVTDSLALAAGATFSVGGVALSSVTGSATSFAAVGNGSSLTTYANTVSTGATAISFQVGAPAVTPMVVMTDGAIRFPIAGTPAVGKYLTCLDTSGTAEWQTPAIPSDARWKVGIRPLEGAGDILAGLRGVRFTWRDSGEGDVGVVAQEVAAVLPEAVTGEGSEGPLLVHYHKLIPVLLETVKGLEARVRGLEAAAAAPAASAAPAAAGP